MDTEEQKYVCDFRKVYVWNKRIVMCSQSIRSTYNAWISVRVERGKIKCCAGKYDEFDSVRFTLVCRLAQESTKRTLNFVKKIVMGSGERVPVVGTTFLRIDDAISLL